MSHERMSVKRLVSYSMFVSGIAELMFSFWHPHHEITWIEAFEALVFLLAGVVLYATDIHKIVVSISQSLYKSVELKVLDGFHYAVASFFRRLSEVMYKYPELRGIDALNYFIANLTISFSQHFRKTHTGVLSYNMLAVLIGIILLVIILFLFGGYTP